MPVDLGLAMLGSAAVSTGGGLLGGIFGNNGNRLETQALKDAIDKSNKENAARYQQLLSGASKLGLTQIGALNTQYRQLFNQFDQMGPQAALERNRVNTNAEINQANQAMIGRGLYNSSASVNAANAAQREGNLRADEINNQYLAQGLNLRDSYTRLLLNAIGNTYGARSGAIQSVSDQGPNIQAYAQLAANKGTNPLASAFSGAAQNIAATIPAYASAVNQQDFNKQLLDYLKTRKG